MPSAIDSAIQAIPAASTAIMPVMAMAGSPNSSTTQRGGCVPSCSCREM